MKKIKKVTKKVKKPTPEQKIEEKVKKMKVQLEDIFNYSIAGWTKPNMQRAKRTYTKILNNPADTRAMFVLMSPKSMLYNCFDAPTHSDHPDNWKWYGNLIFPPTYKTRWAIPYIDIVREKARGRGRVHLCLENGVEKVPVLLVGKSQDHVKNWLKEKKIEYEVINA